MGKISLLRFEDYYHLSFKGEVYLNKIKLIDIWNNKGEQKFIADICYPEKEILFKTNGWYHCLYNSKEALSRLINNLPKNLSPRFLASPKPQWEIVKRRWP